MPSFAICVLVGLRSPFVAFFLVSSSFSCSMNATRSAFALTASIASSSLQRSFLVMRVLVIVTRPFSWQVTTQNLIYCESRLLATRVASLFLCLYYSTLSIVCQGVLQTFFNFFYGVEVVNPLPLSTLQEYYSTFGFICQGALQIFFSQRRLILPGQKGFSTLKP